MRIVEDNLAEVEAMQQILAMIMDEELRKRQTNQHAPLPDHDLDQSPCYPILAKKQGYFYCELHPEIKNVHLKSIEHYIKYKDHILTRMCSKLPLLLPSIKEWQMIRLSVKLNSVHKK